MPELDDLTIGGLNSSDAVLMVGEMTDKYEAKKYNPIGNYYKPIFYILDKKNPSNEDAFEETIPLRDYYHRHSRLSRAFINDWIKERAPSSIRCWLFLLLLTNPNRIPNTSSCNYSDMYFL